MHHKPTTITFSQTLLLLKFLPFERDGCWVIISLIVNIRIVFMHAQVHEVQHVIFWGQNTNVIIIDVTGSHKKKYLQQTDNLSVPLL